MVKVVPMQVDDNSSLVSPVEAATAILDARRNEILAGTGRTALTDAQYERLYGPGGKSAAIQELASQMDWTKPGTEVYKAAPIVEETGDQPPEDQPPVVENKRIFSPSLIPSAPTPTPSAPAPTAPPIPPPPPIKTAAPDIILFDNTSVPIEIMTDLIFENIGGQELINIARNDTINGQSVIYQPIKNLSIIQQLYNPNNILSLQQTSEKYFQNFSIKLEEKIPNTGNGPDGSNVYIDDLTGDLVIELINILDGEQVESQISINGTIYDGTI